MRYVRILLALLLVTAGITGVRAASLQVFPVQLDLKAPAAASKLTLRNIGTTSVVTQVRIYRWHLTNGKDELVETRDVVASPPLITVAPKAEQLIRVVRAKKDPVVGEESYRLIIDEIPDTVLSAGSGVKFAVRYSIPVFFSEPAQRRGTLLWTVSQHSGTLTVSASNTSDRRVRVSKLKVTMPNGDTASFGNGLTGYVLANSVAAWSVKDANARRAPGSRVLISAETDNGPVQATSDLQTLP